MKKISENFSDLKKSNPETIKELAHVAKTEKERSATVDLQLRHELFKRE